MDKKSNSENTSHEDGTSQYIDISDNEGDDSNKTESDKKFKWVEQYYDLSYNDNNGPFIVAKYTRDTVDEETAKIARSFFHNQANGIENEDTERYREILMSKITSCFSPKLGNVPRDPLHHDIEPKFDIKFQLIPGDQETPLNKSVTETSNVVTKTN